MTERNKIPFQRSPHEPSSKPWFTFRHGVEEKPVFKPIEPDKSEGIRISQIRISTSSAFEARNAKDEIVESSYSSREIRSVNIEEGGEK